MTTLSDAEEKARLQAQRRSRRLHKVLSVLGAAIIAATFVAKDVLRENLKDEIAESRAAGLEFQTLVFHSDEMWQIQHGANTGLLGRSAGTVDKRSTKGEAATNAEGFMQDPFSEVISHVDVLTNARSSDNKEVSKLKCEANNAVAELGSATDRVRTAFGDYSNAHAKEKATKEQVDAVSDLSANYGKAWSAVRKYLESSLAVAQEQDEEKQKRYNRFTSLSYVLYGLGAVITIWGKVVEDKADSSEIEGVAG